MPLSVCVEGRLFIMIKLITIRKKDGAVPMSPLRQRNYTPLIIGITVAVYVLIAVLYYLPKAEWLENIDLTILPMLNAVFNSFTFLFLSAALLFIKRRNIEMHRNFIFAAFASTFLFLLSYVSYQYATEPTPYGGEGLLRSVYYFILISHILLAAIIVPLALFTTAHALNNNVAKHRRLARVTMPLWLYVSATGVIVYLLIAPYYS